MGKMSEFVKKKIEDVITQTEKLWKFRIPLQVRYHLQRMCIDTELEYIFKATGLDWKENSEWIKEMQNKIENAYSPVSKYAPYVFRRLPVKYYGIGLLNIKDRWTYTRKSFENRMEKKEDDALESYYKEKMKKWKRKNKMPDLDVDRIPSRTNVSIASPPYMRAHRLTDNSFKLMLCLRYNSETLDDNLKGMENIKENICKYHPKLKMSLQHAISCAYLGKRYVIEQHERICQIITAVLKKSNKVYDVKREIYTQRQKERMESGQEGHRADITFRRGSKIESIDVIVTSSNNNGKQNNVTRARSVKLRQYDREDDLHVILFDTTGNLTNESWNFLESIGIRMEELRTIQKIIYECTERKIDEIIENNKN